jgi:SAM-dependent MidA family methyltransferase
MRRFDEFMADALYGPNGFYSVGGRAGRRGDFLTSPEVGPLFGAVLARALDVWWTASGRPDEFCFIEVGAGPGTFARSVIAAQPEVLRSGALRYLAVEISESQRASHPAGVESLAEIPAGPISGVVFANELLDNLPFRLAVMDGQWREAFVDDAGDEVLGAAIDVADLLPTNAPHGGRAPLQTAATEWVTDIVSRLVDGGRLVAIDYVTGRTAELAMRPWRDWLRTYRGHERGEHYLRNPGSQDITTQVCLDQLPEPSIVRSQAQALQLWGIEELVEDGRRIWSEQAARPGLEAMTARSRIRESEALLDPAGLGNFLVMEWTNPD